MSRSHRLLLLHASTAAFTTWVTQRGARWATSNETLCDLGARGAIGLLNALEMVPTTGAILAIAILCMFGVGRDATRVPAGVVLFLTVAQASYLCWLDFGIPL